MVSVTVEALTDAPCPRAEVTVGELGLGDSVVTIWRNADGDRQMVSGARRLRMVDSGFFTDFHVPLGRPVVYEVEVISGPGGASRTHATELIIESDTPWLMDPLVPQSAVPIAAGEDDGMPYLRAAALSELEYAADVTLIKVMGSDMPVAMFGQRMKARGVPLAMATNSAAQNKRLKELLMSSAQLLYRPIPAMGQLDLPGAMFISVATARELPVNMGWAGYLTNWDLTVDTVSGPAIKVLTATFTYGDVRMLFATYQQKQDSLNGQTYLDDLKRPTG